MNKEQLVSATTRKMKAAKGEENRYAKWEIALIIPYVLDATDENHQMRTMPLSENNK